MFTVNITIGKRALALLVALTLVVISVLVASRADAGAEPPGDGIARVYIAVGTGFADALGVGPGAAANGAPIILVPTNLPLDGATITELERLDPREVVIVGGTGVVSTAVENSLKALLPNAAFSRIGGANRYVTNTMFSASVYPVERWVSVPVSAFVAPTPHTDVVSRFLLSVYNASSGTMTAPVSLPDGAEILELKANIDDTDTDEGDDIEICLYLDATSIACTESAHSFGSQFISTTSISGLHAIVDNSIHAYQVVATGIPDTSRFLSMVMIRYRLGAGA